MSRDILSFREKWNGPSFLNRLPSAQRMTARDEVAREKRKKTGKTHEHYRKDWDKDLWD